MSLALFHAEPGQQSLQPLPGHADEAYPQAPGIARRKSEPRLAATDQLQIDLRQKLGIDACAMCRPRREIDVETAAKLVQRIARPWEAPLGDGDGVNTG